MEDYSRHELLVALFMHLVPSFILLVLLLVAWKWGKVGGWLFLLLFLFFMWMSWGNFPANMVVGGPLLLIGILFLISGKYGHKS